MKKLLTFITIILIMVPLSVNAASGTIKVTSSTSTGTVGNTITYTVMLSSSSKIGSWEMTLNYDSSYLSLSSTTAENNTKMADSSSSGTYSKTYTYTFKILKSGSSTVSVSSYKVYAFSDMSSMSITPTGKTVTFKTQAQIEASYSSDNTLSSLEVDGYGFDEEFSKTTYEYNVTVPEDTENITISADKNNYYASVSGTGEKAVQSGVNTFEIKVTAQNGDEQTYKINVNVVDENPIVLAFASEEYTVVKIAEYLTGPDSFTESTIEIDEIDVPCFVNEVLGYTLIGLKDENGDIELYIYDESGSYEVYSEISSDNLTVIYLGVGDKIDGYTKSSANINEKNVAVYKLNDDSRFSVFYGKNVYTGEETYYLYDEIDGTMMVFDDEYARTLENSLTEYEEIILYFAAALSFTFLLLIISLLTRKKKKKHKKNKEKLENKEEQIEETRIVSEDVDIIEKKQVEKISKKKKNNKKKVKEEEDF